MTHDGAERDGYVLGRNPQEYERLRARRGAGTGATERLLDEVGPRARAPAAWTPAAARGRRCG